MKVLYSVGYMTSREDFFQHAQNLILKFNEKVSEKMGFIYNQIVVIGTVKGKPIQTVLFCHIKEGEDLNEEIKKLGIDAPSINMQIEKTEDLQNLLNFVNEQVKKRNEEMGK